MYQHKKNWNYLDTTHSPLCLYTFNESINDSSGNGYNLTPYVTTEPYSYINMDNGLIGISFSSKISPDLYSSDAAFIITGDLTIQGIIRFDRPPNLELMNTTTYNTSFLVSCGGYYNTTLATNNFVYGLKFNYGDEKIYMQNYYEYGTGTVVTNSFSNVKLPHDKPFHFGFIRDGYNETLIVNGNISGSQTIINTYLPSYGSPPVHKFAIGHAYTSSSVNRGMRPLCTLSSLKINNSALTPQQIVDEYKRVIGA